MTTPSGRKRWVPSAEDTRLIDAWHTIRTLKETGDMDHSTEGKRRLGWRTGPANECVGCGYCCLKVMCWIGLREYGFNKRCPALTWSNTSNRYYCKLAKEDAATADNLSVGAGCSSSLNTWRIDVRERRSIDDNE